MFARRSFILFTAVACFLYRLGVRVKLFFLRWLCSIGLPKRDEREPRVVYVVRIDALGDCLISLPTLRALYEYYHSDEGGHCKVILLMNEVNAAFFKNCPWKDEIIHTPPRASFRERLAFLRFLAARHPVAVFNLVFKHWDADCLACLCGTSNTYAVQLDYPARKRPSPAFLNSVFRRSWRHARQTHGILRGIPYYFSYFLTQDEKMRLVNERSMLLKPLFKHRIKGELLSPEVESQLKMVSAVTGRAYPPEPLPAADWLCEPVPSLPPKPYLVFGVGGSMLKKILPPEKSAAVLMGLHREFPDLTVVFTGVAREAAIVDEILGFVPEDRCFPYLNLCGKSTLGEVATIIRHARFMVGYNTGTSHLAGVLDVPIFVILDWAEHGSFFPSKIYRYSHTITTPPRECAFCCWLCPYMTAGRCNCIAEIQPEAVVQTVVETMKSGKLNSIAIKKE